MNGYSDIIRQWATDNRRAGVLPKADGTGEVGLDAAGLGKRLAVRFTLKVEQNRVTDARYQVFGCGFSMAACAMAADLSVGYTLDEVQAIDAKRLDTALQGLPAERDYCAQLAVQALQAAAKSARNGHRPVQASLPQEVEPEPRVTLGDPVYSALVSTTKPCQVTEEDRHLFACLLSVAAQEKSDLATALGLKSFDLDSLLGAFFPGFDRSQLDRPSHGTAPPLTHCHDDVLSILLSHVSLDTCSDNRCTAVWLAHILAARTARPGHLWRAMGLFERAELTAAIRRHLPSLATANHQNMRWKRYLYRQVCDRNGGTMCQAPHCGVCSDYALCFAEG